jgi:hypothetical protein
MKVQVVLILIEVALIIGALAVYLIATIRKLLRINLGLSRVFSPVGQIVAKTAPVNALLGNINGNLATLRDALEGLMWKKAGADAAGIVESLYPGEGANYLRRIGKSGSVVDTGPVYGRGKSILGAIGGALAAAAEREGVGAAPMRARSSRPWDR